MTRQDAKIRTWARTMHLYVPEGWTPSPHLRQAYRQGRRAMRRARLHGRKFVTPKMMPAADVPVEDLSAGSPSSDG